MAGDVQDRGAGLVGEELQPTPAFGALPMPREPRNSTGISTPRAIAEPRTIVTTPNANSGSLTNSGTANGEA